ncbi:MAG: hypothetical protein ACETVY_00030 [Candidatus Bathyarchaeia archaeon]
MEEGLLERFGDRINELEAVVREIAIEMTTGTFVERLPPERVWDKTGDRITMAGELINELKEYLFMLKPEKVPAIQRQVNSIYERLGIFKEALSEEAADVKSHVSVDELRQALVDISEFVSLCRAVKSEPSDVIGAIISLREGQRTEAFTVSKERLQHLGDLVKEAQASYREATEVSSRMERQLEAIRSEYERLLTSLMKKEEE